MKDLYLMNDFYQLCEELFAEWKEGSKELVDDSLLTSLVDLSFPPQPYVILKQGDMPLFILKSNAERTTELSPILDLETKKYIEFARELGEYYTLTDYQTDFNHKSFKKIHLTTELGFNAVIDIATIPFFSRDLNKSKVINEIRTSYILFAYTLSLQTFLFDKSVLIPINIDPTDEICLETLKKNEWLLFQLNILEVPIESLKMVDLDKQNGQVTRALFSLNNKHVLITSL
ncbi:hypothetical protein OAD28_01265 [Flavobacteriales bacterium]|nr:hypothetical protein [Flavobacteriales bacterium]